LERETFDSILDGQWTQRGRAKTHRLVVLLSLKVARLWETPVMLPPNLKNGVLDPLQDNASIKAIERKRIAVLLNFSAHPPPPGVDDGLAASILPDTELDGFGSVMKSAGTKSGENLPYEPALALSGIEKPMIM